MTPAGSREPPPPARAWYSGIAHCHPVPCCPPLGLVPPCPLLFLHRRLQLATAGAGVDVVKVVERQPALLLVDEASPLSDWSQMDQDELQQQMQVSSSHCYRLLLLGFMHAFEFFRKKSVK